MRHTKDYTKGDNYTDIKGRFLSYRSDEFAGKLNSLAYSHHIHHGGECTWSFDINIINRSSEVESMFNKYAEKWKDETGVFSTTFHKVANDSYLDIIGMGKAVIPYILKDMNNGGTAHWHSALKALSKENPVPDEDLNKSKKIKQAWISWGRKKGLL